MSVTATPVAAPVTGTMTLTTARAWLQRSGRNANPGPYDATDLDLAIAKAGNWFVDTTDLLRRVDAVSLTADSIAADLSALTGFRPELLRGILLTDTGGAPVPGYGDVLGRLVWDALWAKRTASDATGEPQFIAFRSWTSASVYPTPAANRKLEIEWSPRFTAWTPGTDTPDAIVLNVPHDLMIEILDTGAVAKLQMMEKETPQAAGKWQAFERWCQSKRSAGSMGATSLTRERRA
jgi:hypothetical protein